MMVGETPSTEVVDQRIAILKAFEAGEKTQYETGQALIATGLSLRGTAMALRLSKDMIKMRREIANDRPDQHDSE
jgi:hypothetical protein